MRYVICSVGDSASESFERPFVVPALGVAVRMFQDEVNRNASDNMMFHHPEHFTLYHVGYWESSTGGIEPLVPVKLSTGVSVKLPS